MPIKGCVQCLVQRPLNEGLAIICTSRVKNWSTQVLAVVQTEAGSVPMLFLQRRATAEGTSSGRKPNLFPFSTVTGETSRRAVLLAFSASLHPGQQRLQQGAGPREHLQCLDPLADTPMVNISPHLIFFLQLPCQWVSQRCWGATQTFKWHESFFAFCSVLPCDHQTELIMRMIYLILKNWSRSSHLTKGGHSI